MAQPASPRVAPVRLDSCGSPRLPMTPRCQRDRSTTSPGAGAGGMRSRAILLTTTGTSLSLADPSAVTGNLTAGLAGPPGRPLAGARRFTGAEPAWVCRVIGLDPGPSFAISGTCAGTRV